MTDQGLSRRDFLKRLGLTCGLAAAAPWRALAEEPSVTGAQGRQIGMLVDLTRCIGCRSCVRACKRANKLAGDDFETPPIEVHQDLAFDQYTVVNGFQGLDRSGRSVARDVKQQCMHCLEPACASACPVGALHRHELGAVICRTDRCIGCRYCMVACPFDVPKYEWNSGLTPVIGKCQFCAQDRLFRGLPPACAEACPTGAIKFGLREALLAEGHERIRAHPEKYIDRVYGENEAGGTAWLYLSDVPFENLGFKNDLPQSPLPSFTWEVVSRIPAFVTILAALFGMVATSLPHKENHP